MNQIMDDALLKEVKQALEEKKSIEFIEMQLIEKGYLESDISKAIDNVSSSLQQDQNEEKNKGVKRFFLKEIFDRVGYGFGSQQFVNILFFHTGASLFIIGLINGIRAVIGTLFSSVLKEYSRENVVNNRSIGYLGILFGFCFIVMAIARFFSLVWLFAIAIIVGALGVVSYGEFYTKLFFDVLKGEKRGALQKVYSYGLMITGVGLLIASYILDRLPKISIFSIDVSGYLIVFEVAAICFIISGYVLTLIKGREEKEGGIKKIVRYVKEYFLRVKRDADEILKINLVFLMLVTATITGVVQILGNSFYGIFIYESFKYVGFGGFMNVAIISFIALVTSLLTPVITKQNVKEYGKFPMLVFGTMLMAITPLTFYYNPNLVSITVGTLLGVMGAAIVGIAHGFLAMELLPSRLRESYFNMNSIFVTLPYLIIIPIGGYLGGVMGLRKLFLLLGLVLIAVVMPIYFLVVLVEEIKYRRK